VTETIAPPTGRTPRIVPSPIGLARLSTRYLRTRHAPGAAGLIIAFGAFLWVDLHWHWSVAGGPAAQRLVPLIVTAGVASVVGVATYGPFGEPERATGTWLPYLRLGGSLLLAAVAVGAVLGGATGGVLAGGDLALVRDVLGSAGIALLVAAAIGGPFAWIGPCAYWLVVESALEHGSSGFYLWPTRPASDTAALTCAIAVAVAGLAATAVRTSTTPQRLT
jgi:hypothetical protein